MPRAERVAERELAEYPGPIRDDPYAGVLRVVLHGLYDLAWILATILCSPWLLWKSLTSEGFGRMIVERLGRGLPAAPAPGSRPRVLVHGVSVGEVKAAQSVVRMIEERYPEFEVVVCTTTNTGLQVARDIFDGRLIVRFPADITWIVRRFLRRVHPACVVLVELEVWPNFLRESNRAGIPVAVVNGRITENSFFQYQFFKKLLPQFNRISLYCVQDTEYARRFLDLFVGRERLVVTGNVKIDGLPVGPVDPGEELTTLLGGKPGQLVLVAGSTHASEELWIAEAWLACEVDSRLILVPRHPTRAPEIERELGTLGLAAQRLTRLRTGGEPPDPARPAIVDTIGELERVYGLADVVYVGGTLVPHGGQNMLEPAAQGRAVAFGPHVDNFLQEAMLLASAGACVEVPDRAGLQEALCALAKDPERRARMGTAAMAAVRAQGGATELTVAALEYGCLRDLTPRGNGPKRQGGVSLPN